MMRKSSLLRLTLAFVTAILLTTVCFAANVSRSSVRVYVNDEAVSLTGYMIHGDAYYKLRDIAYILRDTTNSFDVKWNAAANQTEVYTQRPYSGEKEDAQISWWDQPASPANTKLTIDGQIVEILAYNVNGSNYYKLLDLDKRMPFSVRQEEKTGNLCIYTLDEHTLLTNGTPGSSRKMTAAASTERWGHVFQSYLYSNNNTLYVVEGQPAGVENALVVDTYNQKNFTLLASRQILMELDTFGGFYAGETYNYIVFGRNNPEESDRKEVIRIVKYSKDFRRLGSVSISGGECETAAPFEAGSLRMAEDGKNLIIHTSRQCYADENGVNQQSQLTIQIDTDSMQITNALDRGQGNHVSHSFNQFVLFDGGNPVLLDHGDAFPRGIVLSRAGEDGYTQTNLLEIPGEAGANCTGVTVGGFEASDSNYLAAVNTIDHSKVTSYGSLSMSGLNRDERDVVLLVCPKDGAETQSIRLTNYVGKGKLGSTPYLVKLAEDRFIVLWQEFSYGKTRGTVNQGVCYVEVDGSGAALMETQRLPNARLSADCQPVFLDGAVTWYVNMKAGRMFYQIEMRERTSQ